VVRFLQFPGMTFVLITKRIFPGLALAVAVAAFAFLLEFAEQAMVGRAWIEALVLAILMGALLRTASRLPITLAEGIRFASKPVMEIAVALMGASVSLSALAGTGLPLIGAIVVLVIVTILGSFFLGKAIGLSEKMAMLVACGNAICGNSAIASVAVAIDADGDDVAASIGFTAVMGIVVVLGVPPLAILLGLTDVKGGMLAGMTVYAVPQVLAAANPLGRVAVQVGALVKLVRVLLLGPVVAVLSFIYRPQCATATQLSLLRFVPLFILIFLGLATLRSLSIIPDQAADIARSLSLWLTVIAMAGLGLSVDMRSVAKAGLKVTATVIMSLIILFLGALAMIAMLA
jgi:uncharacterized integral membrane protein (TIGR00698 family)